MNVQYFFILLFLVGISFGFKSNHQIDRLTKSIFSNKKYKESFIPARYKVGMKNHFEQLGGEKIVPEKYIPDVEFPTNTIEASRPFFYKTGDCNAMLGPFPDDVKSSYKTLLDKNREAFEELKTKYINDIDNINARNCIKKNTEPILKVEAIEEDAAILEEVNDETDEEVNKNESQNEVELKEEEQEDIAIEENEFIETTIESGEAISNDNVEYFEPETEVVEEDNEEIIAEDHFQSWESEELF